MPYLLSSRPALIFAPLCLLAILTLGACQAREEVQPAATPAAKTTPASTKTPAPTPAPTVTPAPAASVTPVAPADSAAWDTTYISETFYNASLGTLQPTLLDATYDPSNGTPDRSGIYRIKQ